MKDLKKIVVIVAVVVVIGGFLLLQRHQSSDDQLQVSVPTNNNLLSSPASVSYKDGVYTGAVGSASQYGDIQVKVTISGGKITNIEYLQFPSGGGHTAEVTAVAQPALKQEAIQAQSANIDTVTGATQDTMGFIQSLQSALDQAKI